MNILGIHDGHNASACIMADGKIVAAISEERLTYRKNDMGFPLNSIRECLNISALSPAQIDFVVFSSINLPVKYLRIKREFNFTIRDWLDEQEEYWKPLIFEKILNESYIKKVCTDKRFIEDTNYKFDDIPLMLSNEENIIQLEKIRKEALKRLIGINPSCVKTFDHHTCHAYYAYFGSPLSGERCLIFTADGGGDGANGTLSLAENNHINEIKRNNCTDLGRIYRYITLLLGMKMGEHEYKVMGLAPYASDYEINKCDKIFKDIFHVPDMMIEYKKRPNDLFFHFRDGLADCRFDGIAGAVQRMLEEIGVEWFSNATKKTGIQKVVFSGGLSMNVKLNKLISELDTVKEFFSPPSGGDESLAVGACYVANSRFGKHKSQNINQNYYGRIYEKDEILDNLSKIKDVRIVEHVENKDVAVLLSKNTILARFSGKMEFGARALGNRSILADPSKAENIKRINKQIKFRDFWMPFAPSVLDKYAELYMINPKINSGYHMTQSYDVTPLGAEKLVAAMHSSDNTVRAHIVTKENNYEYYELIEEFSKLTGIGAVLNTSLNLHGYPIVYTLEQLVHVFENSDIDALLVQNVLVLKR